MITNLTALLISLLVTILFVIWLVRLAKRSMIPHFDNTKPLPDYQVENIKNISSNGFAKVINDEVESRMKESLMDAEEARKLSEKAIQEAVEVFDPKVAKAIKEAALKGDYSTDFEMPPYDSAKAEKILFLRRKGYHVVEPQNHLWETNPKRKIYIQWYPKKSNTGDMIL